MRDPKTNRSIRIKAFVRRTVALVLVLSFFVPSRVDAFGMALDLGMKLLNGDDEQQEETYHDPDQDERAAAADAARRSLKLDGTGTKKVRLKVAKILGVATSDKIESFDMQVDAKTAKMQSSVRSLREKERSMQTVRWSPLFNIKLPTKPNEAEAFEFEFKPVQLQNEITTIKHKITETQMDIYEKVSNTYIDIIFAQNEVTVLEERERKLKSAVAKLEVKVADGTAALEEGVTETDADGNEVVVSSRVLKARLKQAEDRLANAQKRLAGVQEELANARTKFEESKKKLSDVIGFDVTVGYTFEDAFVTANLNRDVIEYLYTVALEDDPNVYEAQMNYDEALLTLRINYELMKKHYNRDIPTLEPYIQQALDGEKINKKAFKKDYDQFLKDIDADWQGSYKIWFIKIPKEWLKGEIDGIRFVEDDPYVLYSATLDFESANKELINAEKDLYNQIYEEYSNYASTRKAYLSANNAYILAEKQLGLDEVRYLLGELTQEEFETEESEYESLKDEASTSLKEFSQTLYSFDRTTCGALTKFLNGAAQEKTDDALSLVLVIRRGCIYTLRPIIDSEEFLLSIDIPDDFYAETGINITHFELYCDGHQIGERKAVGESIRHLSLAVREVGDCSIRVYDGETFIDECQIEPTVFSGPLNITIGYDDDVDAHTLGTYVASDEVATNMLVLTLNLDQEEVRSEYENGNEAAYYRLMIAKDQYLQSDRLVPVNQQFTYMSFIKGDLENVFIELYDEDMEEIGIAKFDTKTQEIYNDIDEIAAAELAEKKRREAIQRAKEQEEADARAAEEEKREMAIELLRALGYPTDSAAVLYAMQHMNQLAYSLELIDATESLKQEHENDVEKYNKLVNDPDADPKELERLEDRMRITELMPGIYENTMSEEAVIIAKEMEERKKLYIKELVAEYAMHYNSIKNETAEDVAAAQARMEEIETEAEEVYNSDAIEVFKQDVIPFEEALDRLYAYSAADFMNHDKLGAYKTDYDTCKGKISTLVDKGYGTSFEPRLVKAAYVGYTKAKTNMDGRDPENPPDIYTITAEEFDKVDMINEGLTMLQGYISGTTYAAETLETTQLVQAYYKALKEVEEARLRKIDNLNTSLEVYYKQLMPQEEAKLREADAQKKYDDAKKEYDECKALIDKYNSQWKDYKSFDDQRYQYGVFADVYAYAQTIKKGLETEPIRLQKLQSEMTSLKGRLDTIKKTAADSSSEGTIKTLKNKANQIIDEILKLHGEPKYTKEDVETKATQVGEAKIKALNDELNSIYNSFEEIKSRRTTASKAGGDAQEEAKTAQAELDKLQPGMNEAQSKYDSLRFAPREKQKYEPEYRAIKDPYDAQAAVLAEKKAAVAEAQANLKAIDLERDRTIDSGIAVIEDIRILQGTPDHTEADLYTKAAISVPAKYQQPTQQTNQQGGR